MFEDLLNELMDLDNDALDDRHRDVVVKLRALQAEHAAIVTVSNHRGVHLDHEHRTPNGYIRQVTNCSRTEASRLCSTAKAVDRIDGLGEAWITGRIGSSQVQRLARLYGNRRVRDEIPNVAEILIQQAEDLPYADFDVCVERFVNHADIDGAHDARDDAVEHREASVIDVGGMVAVAAHGGDPLQSAELISIFRQFCEHEFQHDLAARRAEHGPDAEGQPLPRTKRQRSFDALLNIFRTAASADQPGRAAEPLVNVLIDAATFTKLLTETGLAPDGSLVDELLGGEIPLEDRRCETADGVQLHPHDALRAALAGHVRRVVVDSRSVVIDQGRKQRVFTGPARDAAKLLIRHCEHPGCDLPVDWCHVDHSTEWADGGETNQDNAGIECGRHNTTKHRRRWKTKRALNGRNYTSREDGSIILPAGARPPTFPDEPDDDESDVDPAEIIRQIRTARQRVADLRRPA